MKKIISILVMICAFSFVASATSDTINYYVDAVGGDDANDGLTVEASLKTVDAVVDSLTAAYAISTNDTTLFVVNIAAGTYTTTKDKVFNCATGDRTLSVEFKGAGANMTTFTGGDTYPSLKFFIDLLPANNNTKLTFEDLTIDNFGNVTRKAFIAIINRDVVGAEITLERCNFTRMASSNGAIILNLANTKVIAKDCYFGDMISDATSMGAVFDIRQGELTLENNVFNNCVSNNPLFFGAVNLQPSQGTAGLTATIVNNTFINNKIENASEPDIDQGIITVKGVTKAITLTLANNLFCDNTMDANNAPANFYDVYIEDNALVTLTDPTNNVMTSQFGLDADVNSVDDTYTYTSTDIDFTMDGDTPELFATTTGVSYVKATGDKVSRGGLSTVAPTYDIAGTMRDAAQPSVGAYEVPAGSTALESSLETAACVYPNPVRNVMYIKGDVARVAIYNIAGVQIKSVANSFAGIDVSQLNSGVFIVKCEDAHGATLAVQRIMKN